MPKSKVLVTGGLGYIGSHVCKQLINKGYLPIIYDYAKPQFSYLMKNSIILDGNLQNTNLLENIITKYQPSYVIHMAASISPHESILHPEAYYDNNVVSTLSLLKAMQYTGLRKLIFSSTAAVYGLTQHVLIDETCETRPINPYGTTKLICEKMIQEIGDSCCIDRIIFRYFNAVGNDPENKVGNAKREPTSLLPIALLTAERKRDILQIYGTDYNTHDGTAIRDYIHVEDVASAHIKALELLERRSISTVLNLGTGVGYSVLDVVNMVKKVTGKTVPIVFNPRRKGDPEKTIAITSKANKLLKWQTQRNLEEMVRDSWNWMLHWNHQNSH